MNSIINFISKSIKRKIIISFVLTNIFLMSVFIYQMYKKQKEFLHNQSLSQVVSLTKTLSRNSVSWVLSNDYIGMEEIIDSVSSYPDLKYAMILDPYGKVLSHTNIEYNGKYIADKISLKILNKEPKIIILKNGLNIVDIAMPILRENQHIGWVRIALGQELNNESLQSISNSGIVYIILAILISILFSYILAIGLTKGLHNLIFIAKQTATGKKNLRADIYGNDEVGLLSLEVNRMLDKIEEDEYKLGEAKVKLEDDIEELERMDNQLTTMNKSLENKVLEKTEELVQFNLTLKDKIKDEVLKNRLKDNILFQQSKMASMGEMIGNIAHQWRQPISIIAMWANNIIADIDMDEIDKKDLRLYANNITSQTKQLSQTIEDFRNFFVPNKEKTKFTIQDSINKTMSLLVASFKTHNIEVIENIEDIKVELLENELTQAILNIVKNSKDIIVTLPEDTKRLIFITVYKDNENLIIEIKDNGGGVPIEIQDKIFEPYFTTKHKSQGTGIGLYMTNTIITKHLGGKLILENEKYEYQGESYIGAKFKAVLPLN